MTKSINLYFLKILLLFSFFFYLQISTMIFSSKIIYIYFYNLQLLLVYDFSHIINVYIFF